VTNSYDVFLVSQAFVDGTKDGDCVGQALGNRSSPYTASFEHLSSMLHNISLERIEKIQCITEYAKMVQPTRRNLLLVAKNEDVKPRTNVSTGLPIDRPCIENVKNNAGVYWRTTFLAGEGLYYQEAEGSYSWLCTGLEMESGETCPQRIEDVKRAPQWKVGDEICAFRVRKGDRDCEESQMGPVDYCLSERVTARCELHFSTTIAVIVTIINFCKFMYPLKQKNFAHYVCRMYFLSR
jgi:hypothetical protein